jgi:TRAP-type C4-dicarboxylate transport system substrate-binding protein
VRKRSWVWRLAAVVAALALALGLAACGDDDDDSADTAGAEGGTELTVQYVTTVDHPYGVGINAFIEDVNAAGVGLTLQGQPSNPTPEPDLIDQLSNGDIQIASISSAVWDTKGVTAFQALQAPFLITNYGLEAEVLGGDVGAAMIEAANQEARNIEVLAIHEGGLRKPLGASKAFVKPADFQGATIRSVQSDVLATGLRTLGANPDPLPLPEVYQALQNGTVDGMEANLGLIATQGYYEVAKNVTGNVNFWPFPTVLAMNKDAYDALTSEQQQQLKESAPVATAAAFEFLNTPSELPQSLVNCGIKFATATPADQQALAQAGQQAVAQLPQSTQDFVSQIEAVKEAQPPSDPPPPFPTQATGECELG